MYMCGSATMMFALRTSCAEKLLEEKGDGTLLSARELQVADDMERHIDARPASKMEQLYLARNWHVTTVYHAADTGDHIYRAIAHSPNNAIEYWLRTAEKDVPQLYWIIDYSVKSNDARPASVLLGYVRFLSFLLERNMRYINYFISRKPPAKIGGIVVDSLMFSDILDDAFISQNNYEPMLKIDDVPRDNRGA